MSEKYHHKSLKIRLTTKLPQWAEAGMYLLRQQPDIEVFEANSDVDEKSIDVVLHFGCYSEAEWQKHGSGRLGFWFFRFGGQDIDEITVARQAAAAGVALEASLWVKFVDNSCGCVYQSFGQVRQFNYWCGAIHILEKAAYFPERVLCQYRKKGELATFEPEQVVISTASKGQLLLAESKAIWRRNIERFFDYQWFIVAGEWHPTLIPNPQQKKWLLNPPSDSFWADPFILEKEERIWLLFEVLPFATQRGYLAAVELFADGSYSSPQNVMVADYHLSYPFFIEWEGEIYLLPEAGESKEISLWKCEEFPGRWTKAATFLTDVNFADATAIQHEGLWWLFVTQAITEKISLNEELYLYYADSLFGPWTAHPENPVKSDARNARCAGNLFYDGGVLYRPSQDCSTDYGKATVLNRIDKLDKETFRETPVTRLEADWSKDCLSTHTLSRSQNYWAIDGLRLLPRWTKWFNWIMKT